MPSTLTVARFVRDAAAPRVTLATTRRVVLRPRARLAIRQQRALPRLVDPGARRIVSPAPGRSHSLMPRAVPGPRLVSLSL